MDFRYLFGADYLEVKPGDDLVIDEFLNEEADYLFPLKEVYVHKNNNEMFLVLDCSSFDESSLMECISIWEYKILSYVNFGTQLTEHKTYLKFNTSLILQVSDLIKNNTRYEIEKSKRICRKIVIELDKDEKLNSNEITMLPFYFNFDTGLVSKDEMKLEKKLKEILPEDSEIQFALSADGDLSDANYKKILEWIDDYEK